MNNLLITCEHAGNQIPTWLRKKIKIPKKILESHRGYDFGTLAIAKKLSLDFNTDLIFYQGTRLVLDYNRSLHNPKIWSQYSKSLSKADKEKLIQAYQEYRNEIEAHIKRKKNILHLAIHSFTPILNGNKRNAEIGLLFDPKNKTEKKFCDYMKKELNLMGIKTRLNYPYLGVADGLATALRKEFKNKYAGIEVEFNQSVVNQKRIYKAFSDCLNSYLN
mgnify:FL=1